MTVAEILGHSDIKMTIRCAHPTPENKRKAVDVLADVFGERVQKEDMIEKQQALIRANMNLS